MPIACESDPLLVSLNDELRACLAAANQLHHPVIPASPRRIQELEHRIDTLRQEIRARTAALAGS